MKAFLTTKLPEFFACLVATGCLASAVFTGFYISDGLAANYPLTFILSAVLLTVLYASGYSRRALAISAAIMVAIAILGLGTLGVMQVTIHDAEGNPTADFIYYIAIYCCALACFLFSRHRFGALLLVGAGAVVIGSLSYLHFAVQGWMMVLFVAAELVVTMSRSFAHAHAGEAGVPAGSRNFILCALLVCSLCAGAATVICLAVVEPLQPPTLNITLFTQYLKPQVLEMLGITDIYHLPGEETSDQIDEEHNNADTPDQPEETQEDTAQNEEDSTSKDIDVPATAINYEIVNYTLIFILLGIVIVLAAVLVGTALYNHMRRKRMLARSHTDQVVSIYNYLTNHYRKLKIPVKSGETPQEYAERLAVKLPSFPEKGIDFRSLARVFSEVFYGGRDATAEESTQFLRAFDAFQSCCRNEVGWLRYVILFFR